MRTRVIAIALAACAGAPPRSRAADHCDATWHPQSCLDAGHHWEQVGETRRARDAYWRSCKNGMLEGCHAGIKYETAPTDAWGIFDSPPLPFRARACDLGDETSCLNVVEHDKARRIAMLDAVCTRTPSRCADAAELAVADDEEAARRFVQRACAVPLPEVCERGAHVVPATAERSELLRAACQLDRAASCFALVRVAPPEEHRGLLEHACRLGHRAACEALGALLSR